MKSKQRHFSLEEANTLVPKIQALLIAYHEKKQTYERSHDYIFMNELLLRLEDPARSHEPAGQWEKEARDLDEAYASLEKEITGIAALGCVIRSMEKGFVDFLGVHGGETVYFSWRMGEKSIQYYRTASSPVAERLPL